MIFFFTFFFFKDYLRKLNKIKIGCLANKAKSNDINFYSLKIISRKLAKPKKYFFPQIKSIQVIKSCYPENYKRLTCKVIRSVFLYREKPVNRSLKIQN